MSPDLEKELDSIFLCISFLFHGLMTFILSYALRCHLKFRKLDQQILLVGNNKETTELPEDASKIKQAIWKLKPVIDRYVVSCFCIYIVYAIITILLFTYAKKKQKQRNIK